jgi:hypothetical protein
VTEDPRPAVHPLLDENLPFEGVPNSGRGAWIPLKQRYVNRRERNAWNKLLDQRTRPWTLGEFFWINGIPYVYTIIPRYGTIIHLPGGKSKIVRDLWVKREHMQAPQTVRLDDIYHTPAPHLLNEL